MRSISPIAGILRLFKWGFTKLVSRFLFKCTGWNVDNGNWDPSKLLQSGSRTKAWFPFRCKWRERVPVSGYPSQSVGTRPSQWNGDTTGTLTMIWERFFGDVADVPVVSPTSQSRRGKLRSVQLLRMPPMHRRHVPVDDGMSPSLTTIWKPGFSSTTRLKKLAEVSISVINVSFFAFEKEAINISPNTKSLRVIIMRFLNIN